MELSLNMTLVKFGKNKKNVLLIIYWASSKLLIELIYIKHNLPNCHLYEDYALLEVNG